MDAKDIARRKIMCNYQNAYHTSSDINEHLPIFRKYATECSHITEMGIKDVFSTWGFALGLLESKATDVVSTESKKIVGVNIDYREKILNFQNIVQKAGLNFEFKQENTVTVDLEQTDLLFIDTWHVYGHLKRELKAHEKKVNKYIIIHDTTVDAEGGESIRCCLNIDQQVESSGYPREEITKGIWPAIEEFLIEFPTWKLKQRLTNNNGLTILENVAHFPR